MRTCLELHTILIEEEKYILLHVCYIMPFKEKYKFCQFLVDLKLSNGYSSNISWCINIKGGKIYKMKCHDSYIFL